MDGDNQLNCDTCGTKTDSLKGIEIGKLPPVLTFNLYRFDLDYETWQRKKLDDRFEYPLEIDMGQYCSDEVKANF
jgi:ubiquitin C-terminal hydrolase